MLWSKYNAYVTSFSVNQQAFAESQKLIKSFLHSFQAIPVVRGKSLWNNFSFTLFKEVLLIKEQ